MKQITTTITLTFDSDQITSGSDEEQIQAAIDEINLVLQRQPYGLGAQVCNHD